MSATVSAASEGFWERVRKARSAVPRAKAYSHRTWRSLLNFQEAKKAICPRIWYLL